ncbi:glutamate formimidoyltransferase [Candidatus Peregrinibacteria bacterium]|jgi:glutamate formiminotransferase / 5-formyltetrahydrofolate cyclo-ligase|nr:glutamate formimidoyltransferase [Candidatus Peregrinibacteria bacterium]MBT7736737.1 glutamate formimidoyltransferase [Candidatus Peregrinibacteria bacterium]
MPIVECVPNFSVGKCRRRLGLIKKAIESVEEVKLLNYEGDKDHKRSVFTFIGEPKAVIEAAFRATKIASEIIDITKHKGVHPRIGATDVIPIIPIKGITFKECIKLASKLGKRIGTELKIPVYLYEKAAKHPEKKNLSNTRKTNTKLPPPDFGPKNAGTAGSTMIGVRNILVAFNINLKTKDLEVAKAIAKEVRESSGGLKHVKALGFYLKSRDITQVSMNLTDYKKTPPLKVYKLIERLAHKYKTSILESELIGLAPLASLPKDPKKILKLTSFSSEKILDNHLK